MEIFPLFATDIGATRINPSSYNKQEIVDTIIKNYSKSNVRNGWKNGTSTRPVHLSYDDWENKEYDPINFEILCRETYPKVIEDYFNSLGIFNKFKFYVMHYIAVGTGQGLDRHWHPECDFSMVHYLQVPTESNSIRFHNPVPYGQYAYQGFAPSWIDVNNLNNSKLSTRIPSWDFTVEEDTCIIFPNYVEHEIPSVVDDVDSVRISIVTNIKIEDE